MKRIYERIKELRIEMHLSQEYVAKYLGVNRSTYTLMEKGDRRITAEDISKLSFLYGVSADYIVHGNEASPPGIVFARSFEKLSDDDQAEIMNLIRFKESLKNK